MQNSWAGRPLSSLFGTVSIGQTMQTLDALALDNLFMGTPGAATIRKELPIPPIP